jgi:hypothetical protein
MALALKMRITGRRSRSSIGHLSICRQANSHNSPPIYFPLDARIGRRVAQRHHANVKTIEPAALIRAGCNLARPK